MVWGRFSSRRKKVPVYSCSGQSLYRVALSSEAATGYIWLLKLIIIKSNKKFNSSVVLATFEVLSSHDYCPPYWTVQTQNIFIIAERSIENKRFWRVAGKFWCDT